MDFDSVFSQYPLFLDGIASTIIYSAGCLTCGAILAVAICICRLSHRAILNVPAKLYIAAIRATPLLILLLIAFNLLPNIGISLSPQMTALLSLSVCTSAYQAEILRGGFLSISPGIVEAARISGLRNLQILFHIEVPLAVRATLPALVSEATMMVKGTSLVSVVGILELTRVAQNVGSANFEPLPSFIMAGLMYLVLNLLIAAFGMILERRFAKERF